MSKGLKLTDILVTVVIAVVFAVVYRLWGDVSNIAKLVPGLQLDQLIYGLWFIASSVAYLIIRKPGVALLAEAAAASGELLAGSQYGVEALTYGIVQGLCAELIFAAFRYRKYSASAAGLAGIAAAAGSLVFDVVKGYTADYQSWSLLAVCRLPDRRLVYHLRSGGLRARQSAGSDGRDAAGPAGACRRLQGAG
ncbi:ECF transporter S component [Paenibacillus sp. P26]|nr:ECF transporter S component [Paenibacillus sp. P26]